MHLPGKRSLLLVLAFSLVAGLQAQPQSRSGDADAVPRPPDGVPDYRVERLTSDAGLSSNSAISIAQDAQGFMWFGTWGGLNRYDGSSFKTFYHDPTDPTSLPHDWAESLYVDGEGTLWVGMHAGGGLARFDPATETFTRFSFRDDLDDPAQDIVTVILEDHAGTFWVGTHGGLIRFDRETGAFTRYLHDPDDPTSLSNDQVRAMYVDRSGTFWVGTGSATPTETPAGLGGLNRFDPATGRFIRYLHDPDNPITLFDNKVQSIFEDARGTLWVGTFGRVLNRMDRQSGTFERLMFDPTTPDRLVRPPVSSLLNLCSVDCGQLTFIHEHPSGLLWIGSNRDGLLLYDAEQNRVVRRYHADAADAALRFGTNSAWSFHASVDGTVWVGNAGVGGVHRLVPAVQRFAHLRADPANLNHRGVRQIIATRDGMVWMATWDGGLNRFDPATQAYTHYRPDPADPNSLSDLDVHSIYEDRQGLLWVGTGAGVLNRFDRATGRFTHYRHDPTDPHSIGSGDVLGIRETQDGTFWIVLDFGGLDHFAPETGRFTHYRHDLADSNSLSSDGVFDLLEDQNGDLWVGTFSGLDRIVRDPATGTISCERHLPGTWVAHLYEDREGRFWVGTFNAGLLLFDRATGGFTRFTRADGLPENSIRSIVEDEAGHLWISTPNRLVRFEPEARTFFVFDPADGLPNIEFLARSVARGHDGTLYFGGRGGITAFDPAPASEDPPPKTTLTGLRLRNTPVVPGPDAPLQQPLFQADEIILTHTQNDFTIDYLGLDYRRPGRIRYQYVLEGHDAGWVDARAQHSARYAAVPPGDYVFRVRAASRFGVWHGEPTSVRVTVLPPWWRTRWAYLLYALILGVGIFAVDRLQRRRVIKKERANAEIEQARLREEAAERIRESEQRFRELFEASPDAIFVEDFEGKVLDVNPAACRLHGLERAQLIGQNVSTLVPPEEREHAMELLARMVAGDLDRIEGKSWTVEEEKVPVEISVSQVTYAREPALLLHVRDITERKQAEEERERARERELEQAREIEKAYNQLKDAQRQLIQSEKMASLGQMTAGIAHEIKNPLNFVNNFAQLSVDLADELADELDAGTDKTVAEIRDDLGEILANLKQNAAIINEHGRRADGIVKSMLEHARSTPGERRATDLNALLDEYVNLAFHGMRAQQQGFRCDIERKYDETVGKLDLAPKEIGRVFQNLLKNAFEAVREQALKDNRDYLPTVRVSTRPLDGGVEIRVGDNGPGIPPEIQDKIFEPFFTTKPTGSGTGLGLSLAYDIVTQGHGGTLAVEPTEGEGATLVITLPRGSQT